MKNKVIILVSILLLILGYFAYQVFKVNSLQTVKAAQGEIISSVYASGKTKAEKEAHLTFKATGRIASLPVKKNQVVKKGERLASLDLADLKAAEIEAYYDYLAADANAKQVEDSVKNHDKDESFTQKNQRVTAQTTRDIAYDDWLVAQRAVKNASLYAPFDGIVTEVNGEINEWVSAFSTESLVTVVDPQTIYFSAELEEENISEIKVGQEALVTLDAYPERKFTGTVAEIERQTIVKDNGDTVLPIKVVFTVNDDLPLVGLNGDVQFVLEKKKDILILPKRALKKRNGLTTVTVKDGIVLKTLQIETGISDAKNIQVTKGLTETEQIVLPGELEE